MQKISKDEEKQKLIKYCKSELPIFLLKKFPGSTILGTKGRKIWDFYLNKIGRFLRDDSDMEKLSVETLKKIKVEMEKLQTELQQLPCRK